MVNRKKLLPLLILCFIISLGASVRFYKLNQVPPALNQDELVNGYDAYSLGLTLKDHRSNFLPPILESYGDWSSPAITYFTLPIVRLFGLSPLTTRVTVAILGTLLIVVFYNLVFYITKNRFISLVGALTVGLSGILIHYSRWAIPPSIVPFFISTLLLTSVYSLSSTNKIRSLILLGLISGVATYTYPTQKVFIPIALFFFTLIFIKQFAKSIIILWFVYLIVVLPIFYLSLTDTKYNVRYKQVSLSQIQAQEGGYIKAFSTRYLSYLHPQYLFGKGDPDIRFQPDRLPFIPPIFFAFYLVGIVSTLYQIFTDKKIFLVERKILLYLFLLWVISPVLPSLTKDKFHFLRFIHILPLVYLFIILGIFAVYKTIKQKEQKFLYSMIIIIVILFSSLSYLRSYFYHYPQQSREAFQYGVIESMRYLFNNESQFDDVIVDNAINQPYMFYLFYTKYDPRKLTRELVEKQRFDKYIFAKINDGDVKRLREIYRLKVNDKQSYVIYEKTYRHWLLKKEIL